MTGTGATAARSNLAIQARRSVLWNTGSLTAINLGQFGLMLVLVRLLSPETYGQFGLLMAVAGFLSVFSAQSFVDYLLQVRDGRGLPVEEIFTACVAVNAALCIAINVVAILLRFSTDYASIASPLHWVSGSLLLQAPRALRVALLKRALDWKRIRVLHAIGFGCAAAASVIIALAGGGIYALMTSSYLIPLPYVLDLFVVGRWRPSWSWSLERLRPAFAFGLNRQISGVLSTGRRLLEGSLIVHAVGFAGFGIYGRAVSLADIVCARLVGQSLEALYPALTTLEPGSRRAQRIGALVLRTCVWFVLPCAVLLGMLADPLVALLLGDRWLDVVPLMGWVLTLAGLGAIGHVLYRLLLANEQWRHCLYADGFVFVGAVVSLLWLLPVGLTDYIRGLAATQGVALGACAAWLCRHGALRPAGLGEALLSPLVPLGLAWGTCRYATEALGDYVSAGLHVLLVVMLFVVTYLAVLRLLFPGLLRELIAYFPLQSPVKRFLALG